MIILKPISVDAKLIAFLTPTGQARFRVEDGVDPAMLREEFRNFGQLSRHDGVEIAVTSEDLAAEPDVVVSVLDFKPPASNVVKFPHVAVSVIKKKAKPQKVT